MMDRTNLHLLELLQKHARTSTTDLARVVKRAESTVRERLATMERDGVLKGYRALVDPDKLGFHAHALLRADCDLRKLTEVTKKLEAVPQVTSVMLTTGPKPLRIEVRAESLSVLEQILEKRFATMELENIETAVVVQTLLESRPLAVHSMLLAGQPAETHEARPLVAEAQDASFRVKSLDLEKAIR